MCLIYSKSWDIKLNGKIIIYTASDGQKSIEVKLENETVWLNVNQMAELFGKETSNIRRHILNVFEEGELERESNVHFLHVPFSDKPVPFYSLDMIISVGYRVKSQRGTQFRIWANRILKDYLVKGNAINNSIASQKYEELCHLVQILGRTVNSQLELSTDESHEQINVVSDYTYALDKLDSYDYQQLTIEKTTQKESFHAIYDNATNRKKYLQVTQEHSYCDMKVVFLCRTSFGGRLSIERCACVRRSVYVRTPNDGRRQKDSFVLLKDMSEIDVSPF